jgi:general stress protein YciG
MKRKRFIKKKGAIMSNETFNLREGNDQTMPGYHATGSKKNGNGHRGFAAMNADQQRQIASKGGEAVSKNREHMAEIGKKGGEIVSQNRKHMSEIGRKGGEASKASRNRQ